MAKKKTKKKSGDGFLAGLRARFDGVAGPARLAGPWIAGVLAVGGLGFGAFVADGRGSEVITARAPEIEIVWPDETSGWAMPAVERARLLMLCEEANDPSAAMERYPLARIAGVMDETNWFRSAPLVRRVGERGIIIEGDWRVPAAVLRAGGRDRLISWDGAMLPLEYGAGESPIRYIRGISESDAPDARAAELQRGLRLLELLSGDPAVFAQVSGIDLGLGGTVEILSDRGSTIVWGGAPGRARPGEQPIEVRVDRLRHLVERFGRIDANASVVEIHGPQVLADRPADG